MPDEWARVDAFYSSILVPHDVALAHALKTSDAAGLNPIAVSPAQGKFLNLIARSIGAKRILEVGTLGGYSAIWLARALPEDGELITMELSEKHAKIASKNIEYAGLSSKVKIILGPAERTLAELHPSPPFDLVFIDADKPNNLTYFLEAKRLVRRGGVIIVDNMVRGASTPDGEPDSVFCANNLLVHLKDDKDVDATTVTTAGEKGFDGFLYAIRV